MINTKLYKSIYTVAEKLMAAAEKDDTDTFSTHFAELKAICDDNEDTSKDHPEQWETLADFTEDVDEALTAYAKARDKALAMNSKDHLASIGFSMATIQLELGHPNLAIQSLEDAKIAANKIEDHTLKNEIEELLESLQSED